MTPKSQALTAAQKDLDAKTQAYEQASTARDDAAKQVEAAKTAVKDAEQALSDAQAKLEQAKRDAKDTDAVKAAQGRRWTRPRPTSTPRSGR